MSFPSRTIVHAKLEMTEPGDHDEQEADAVANTMVSGGRIARKISGGGSSSSGIAVSQQMESQLSQLQGGGRQMPEGLRNMMESGLGQDFSQVRLHTDSEAASMSSSIHAKAFTFGNDIYFNRGQFSPETSEGQRLVAHELTHVVQGTGKVGREEEKPKKKNLYVDPNNPGSKDTLLNAKALAKEMISRSIFVLKTMQQQGKYLSLFYYCFDKKSYNAVINNNRRGIANKDATTERIDIVLKNYEKILNVLNAGDIIENDTITYQLALNNDWRELMNEHPETLTPTMGGFAYNYYAVKSLENPNPKYNKVVLNYTCNSVHINPDHCYDINNDVQKWKQQLQLAATIIHELSHRICGTDDFSYLGPTQTPETIEYFDDNQNLRVSNKALVENAINNSSSLNHGKTTNILTKNATSYEMFSAWVESTVYSVFDESFKGDSDGTWSIDTDNFDGHGIPKE